MPAKLTKLKQTMQNSINTVDLVKSKLLGMSVA